MKIEHAESMTFFSGLATASAGSFGMLFHASPIDARLAGVLTVMGVLGVLGSICFFTAVKYAPVSTVSFFHYSQLLSGAVVAYLVFHESLTIAMIAGAALIATSGLYIASVSETQ
jgi:drug/metabolite transporter (DMT)-like permease